MEYDDEAVLINEIELVRILEECDRELPYLLEASGKAPPEDAHESPLILAQLYSPPFPVIIGMDGILAERSLGRYEVHQTGHGRYFS